MKVFVRAGAQWREETGLTWRRGDAEGARWAEGRSWYFGGTEEAKSGCAVARDISAFPRLRVNPNNPPGLCAPARTQVP